MDENEKPGEDESSLVEIEVAEQEEIEVEESETETENLNKEQILKPQKEEIPKKSEEQIVKTDYIEKEVENDREKEKYKQNENENIDKPYSEIELKFIDVMNGSETINNLLNNNNRWDEKKKGFSLLNEYITNSSNREKILTNYEIFFNYIQDVLKNFKESNYIILKEGLECVCSLFNIVKTNNNGKNSSQNEINMNKKFLNLLITELNEKITESKVKGIYLKLIDILMNIYGPNECFNCLIQNINKNNKISLLKEYAIFIKNYIISNKHNIKYINAKDIIDFCIKIGNNNNQQLRKLSTEIICLFYDYIGEDYILYIKNNIKESSFKHIEQELKKMNKIENNDNEIDMNANENKRRISENITSYKYAKYNSEDISYSNSGSKRDLKNKNRNDISKDITPVLLKYINYGKWNDKKEAIDFIHRILNKNDNCVSINGLNDLIELIIEKLVDSNKNLVRLIIELLSHLIDALGVQLKPHTKSIIKSLLSNLSDKNNILRQECLSCLNKWISTIQNFETIFTLIPSFLMNDNNDMRNELLTLLIDNIHTIKKENIYMCHFDDLINAILYCLQDKSSSIRNITELLIRRSINLIPREDYIKKTNKFKPAIEENLVSIINDIYDFIDNDSEMRERNSSKKHYNNFFSPQKLRNNFETNNSVSRRDLLKSKKLSQSIERDITKSSFFNDDNKERKNYKQYTLKDRNRTKTVRLKTTKKSINILSKRNKMSLSSLNTTSDNANKKKKKKIKLNTNTSNITNNVTNNITNNNNNEQSVNNTNNSMTEKNSTASNQIKINEPLTKEKKNMQTMCSIPNIAKRVNKFYNNKKKPRGISNIKNKFKNKATANKINNDSKTNIPNYNKNFNEMMKNIRDNDNSISSKHNSLLSPRLGHKSCQSSKHSFHFNDNSRTTENIFYKRMISGHLNRRGKSDLSSTFENNSRIDNDINIHLFLGNYKIKKDQKEKRIEEDRKTNYCFEIQNFDQIPKIKEIMKNIFCPDFIEYIFSDDPMSIILCINKIKNYIGEDNDKNNDNNNILNIEDNLDLLLKVIGYKLSNNKSSSLIMTTFEFFNLLLSVYKQNKMLLNEIESNIILNILVDKLINNSNAIKEMANSLLWVIVSMIGEELSLLAIIHLIEYKNTKTKLETINIIIKLYTTLLGTSQYHFDNWKMKIIKNIVSLYFEGDHNTKNKILFVIKDLYSSFKNEIWKYCKNLSSKNKDELLKRIKEYQNDNNKYNFDNDLHVYSKKSTTDNINCKYIFSNMNRNKEEYKNKKDKKDKDKEIIKRNEQVKSNKNLGMKKITTNIIYDNKNKKVFENRKITKMTEGVTNSQKILNSDFIDSKKKSIIKSKDILNSDSKNAPKASTKRESSTKKNLFLKHINTNNNPKLNNIISQAANKLAIMNNKSNNDQIRNYNPKLGKNKLSQSTVIINNNYNFIKIKNNDIQIENKDKSLTKKNSQKNSVININNINNNDEMNQRNIISDPCTINILHSNRDYDAQKKKILVNCAKKEIFSEIKRILESLCSGDKTNMTELILKMQNILYTNYKKNESVIITHCDYIFNKIIQTINNLLNEKKIYTNYVKYISGVLSKICKLGDLLSKVNIDTQNNLIILTIKAVSLLDDNENDSNNSSNNNNEENSAIIKNFNSIMLRIIDYGDINNSINLLMNFEKKYRKNDKFIINYVAKCLIIIIKNIKKTYKRIDVGIVIESIYTLMNDLLGNNVKIKVNDESDQIIMITIKNMLNQLILYKGDTELIEYIRNSLNSKRTQKSIFNYQNNDNVKNWLLKYIDKIKVLQNKMKAKNENEDNFIDDNNIDDV